MITKLKAAWTWFWNNHVQKTMAWIAGGMTGLDLIGYAGPIKGLVGDKKYYGIVMTAAVITALKAHLAKTPPVA